MIPALLPQASREQIAGIVASHAGAHHLHPDDSVVLVGVRAYYRDTMGAPGRNDRGIYDDAFFILSPGTFASFHGNCDPSAYRNHIASLKAGVWRYKPGIHGLSKPAAQRYAAFVQADEVTVIRDGEGEDSGWFGINIHRGGINGTSSLGCQTVPPQRDEWETFRALLNGELKRYGQKTFPYILSNGPIR